MSDTSSEQLLALARVESIFESQWLKRPYSPVNEHDDDCAALKDHETLHETRRSGAEEPDLRGS